MTYDLEKMRAEAVAADFYRDTDHYAASWRRYHSALQAMYERGELVHAQPQESVLQEESGASSNAVTTIPSIGFARGAVVRPQGGGPNMLVARGIADRTVVVVCESDDAGSLRLRDPKTDTLELVLPSATPEAT